MTKPVEMPSMLARFDVKDAALIVGVISIIGGIAHFSVAVAAIVFGAMCLFVAVRPVVKSAESGKPERSN